MDMQINKDQLFPIMGEEYQSCDYGLVDLGSTYLQHLNIKGDTSLKDYLNKCHLDQKAKWLTGGYLEVRSLYESDLFRGNPESIRNIHLGVDIWGPVGSAIYAPLNGSIHSFAYNGKNLDYGYTLILEHELNDLQCYTLYGHLGKTHFLEWQVGRQVSRGDLIADFGPQEENGGWIPHLHFQVILDMEGMHGDYPGVCNAADLEHFKRNCPDANVLIRRGGRICRDSVSEVRNI